MPDFDAELQRMKWLQREGKIAPHEPCKVVFPALEAKKRVENKKGRTRLIVELDTPETYSAFNKQFSRYRELTGNPQIAYSLMLRMLEGAKDELIIEWSKE